MLCLQLVNNTMNKIVAKIYFMVFSLVVYTFRFCLIYISVVVLLDTNDWLFWRMYDASGAFDSTSVVGFGLG